MNSEDRRAFNACVRQNFPFFLELAYREIGGEGEYQHAWYIDAIDHQLDRVRNGDNTRLIVEMPPRHLKSMAVSTAWPAFMLGHNPALRFINVTYGEDLSAKHARDCMKIIESSWYKAAFPGVVLTKRSVLDFETSVGGGRMSTSIGGVLMGRGADLIIIDDPQKADEALSEASRNATKTWFYNSLLSRLNDQQKGVIILVMQRLHQADLAGELIERGGWHELRLPAIATEDQRIPIGGGRFYQRRAGCALHPARQPLEVLEKIRAQDPLVFQTQYQQDPVPATGTMIQRKWLKFYDPNLAERLPGTIVQSWDCATKTGIHNDWSVCLTIKVQFGKSYLIDVDRRRLTFPELVKAAHANAERHRPNYLLIEDAASGTQLIQYLLDQPRFFPPPISIRPEHDKQTRGAAMAALIEQGLLYLPNQAAWLPDFISEVLGFPNARHDDQVDAMAQAMLWSRKQLETVAVMEAGPIICRTEDYDPNLGKGGVCIHV